MNTPVEALREFLLKAGDVLATPLSAKEDDALLREISVSLLAYEEDPAVLKKIALSGTPDSRYNVFQGTEQINYMK